jgi:dimethylamine/trimethylamine dehydrogenase
LELIEGVQAAVGGKAAIAVRIGAGETPSSDTPAEDILKFIHTADALVDLWDVNANGRWAEDSVPMAFAAEGSQLAWQEAVREMTTKPIVGVGRYTDPDHMARLVRAGTIDLIGAARQSIADPFFPRKVERGQYEDIRECTGSNTCIASFPSYMVCVQNATAGEEFRRSWHPENIPRIDNAEPVLIVGGGPAALECAVVLGMRAIEHVHVVDAAREVGGHLTWLTQFPVAAGLRRVVDWRAARLSKLSNVSLVLNKSLTVDEVLDYGAGWIVFATGATWSTDGLNGYTRAALVHEASAIDGVLTPESIMVENRGPAEERVVVYDCDGTYVGVGLAERLAHAGHRVELITPLAHVAEPLDKTFEGMRTRARLHQLGVKLTDRLVADRVSEDAIQGYDEFGARWERSACSVVLITQRLSHDEMYRDLHAMSSDALGDAGITRVLRIGDCVSPRTVAAAIFDGHRLGREIELPNAAVPHPTRSERE